MEVRKQTGAARLLDRFNTGYKRTSLFFPPMIVVSSDLLNLHLSHAHMLS